MQLNDSSRNHAVTVSRLAARARRVGPAPLALLLAGIGCLGAAHARPVQSDGSGDGAAGPRGARYEIVGHIGGAEISYSNTLAATGERLYLALGPRLAVVDLSDPVAPRVVGQSDLLPRAIRGMVLRNHLAFVALADYGVAAIDLTDEARPRVIGRAQTAVDAMALAVDGQHLYVACSPAFEQTGQLAVFNVADPTRIEPVSSVDLDGECRAVAARDGYAYVGCGWKGLNIVDVAAPARPRVVAFVKQEDGIHDIGFLGSHVVLPHDFGLAIIDVANKRAPRVVSRLHLPDLIYGIAIEGSRVYVAYYQGVDDNARMQVFDASKPAAPRLEASLRTSGLPIDLVVHRGFAYPTYWQKGEQGTEYVGVVNVSDPAQPREVGGLTTLGQVQVVAAYGNVLYAGKDSSVGPARLHAIDVSDPRAPALLGTLDGNLSELWDLDMAGGYVYVADGAGGLRVVDAADPRRLHAVGQVTFGDEIALDVSLSGSLAFVTTSFGRVGRDDGRLVAVDVADPAHPTPIGSLAFADTPWSVTVAGATAYVGVGTSGLWIVDVANPRAPAVIASAPSAAWVSDTAVRGNLAFAWGSGVHVIDVSDRANPRELSAFGWEYSTWGMAVDGRRLYLAEQGPDNRWQGGLRIYDIADPSQPVELGALEAPGESWGVAAANGVVYLADNFTGLTIVQGGDDAELAPTPTATPWPTQPGPTATAIPSPFPSATPRPPPTGIWLPYLARGDLVP